MKGLAIVNDSSKPIFQVKLMGYPSILYQGKQLTGLRMVKAQALLYFLITERYITGQNQFPKEQLIDLLWPGIPKASALQNLRQAIYRIRKEVRRLALPDSGDTPFILTDRKHVILHSDAPFFSDLYWMSTSEEEVLAQEHIFQALTNAQSKFLSHFSVPDSGHYDEWIDRTRDRIQRRQVRLLNLLMVHYRSEEQLEKAIPLAERLAQLMPYEEGPTISYLELLLATGDPLFPQVHQAFVERYRADLDQEPSPGFMALAAKEHPHQLLSGLRQKKKGYRSWLIGISLVVFLGLGWYLNREFTSPPTAGENLRVAVLPFDNQSAQPYLADGLTDEVIIALSKVDDLVTISRQSSAQYLPGDQPLADIGRALNAPYLIRGTVREQSNALAVAVELLEAHTSEVIWGNTFVHKQEEVHRLPRLIAREVVAQLLGTLELPEEELLQLVTENHRAYKAYLQGRYYFYQASPEGLRRAEELFSEAIALDPRFKRAHSALAWTYCTMAGSWGDRTAEDMYPLVQKSLEQVAGVPGLEGEYYLILSWMQFWLLNTEQAVSYMREAISYDPNLEFGMSALAMFLSLRGAYDEAESYARQGLINNPHFFWNYFVLGQNHFYAGEFDLAREALRAGLDIYDHHSASIGLMAHSFTLSGKPRRASAYLDSILRDHRHQDDPNLLAFKGLALIELGQPEEARDIAQILNNRHQAGEKYTAYFAAMIFAQLGQKDRAFRLLEEALQARDNELNWLRVDYSFRSLQGEERFKALLRYL